MSYTAPVEDMYFVLDALCDLDGLAGLPKYSEASGDLVRRILENTSQVGFLTQSRFEGDPESMLRPPELGEEDRTYRKPAYATGFDNTSLIRLFDASERAKFQAALAETRTRWGSSYPLRIGAEWLETSAIASSLSPSHPDPAQPVGRVYQAGVEEAEKAIRLTNQSFPD